MTDPAERRSLIPRGTFEQRDTTPDVEPQAPMQSYIDQLRHRFDEVAELATDVAADDAALTVPPNAQPRGWIAGDIEAALQAMTDTVLRSPSSPDSPLVFPNDNPAAMSVTLPSVSLVPLPHVPPAAEMTPRNVRRRADDTVNDFPVELDDAPQPTLRTRERGRKSGRFVSPAGLRVAAEQEGSIAAAVTQMIATEQLQHPQSQARQARTAATPALDAPAADAESEPARGDDQAHAVEPHVADVSTHHEAWSTLVVRGVLLFVTASIAGGTAVYFLLHG